ncbi:MAG: QueT transporter family protein [Thermoprotei archaeon]|nr:MAG: QueT transporter family protein [Thermoprotei archaeon]
MAQSKSSILKLRTVKVAVVAAAYAATTVLLAPISFGAFQVRVSDVMMPIPYHPMLGFNGVIGLTIGCLIANLVSPFGVWDVVLGTLANLVSATLSYLAGRLMPRSVIGRLAAVSAPLVVVTLLIGYVLLHLIYLEPVYVAIPGVLAGEAVSAGLGGYLLLEAMDRRWRYDARKLK